MEGTADRDDRLLAPTHWTAVAIVPVLVSAWVILYLFPGRTGSLWAWTVTPDMTCLVMGGGYLSGAYFFARVASSRQWHRVAWGFLATTIFTTVLLLATVLHWDRFNHDHVSFWAWLGLYLVTPPLLPWLFLRNRRTDPGLRVPSDVRVPTVIRGVLAVAGGAQLALALVMFVRPSAVMGRWPWPLTPLTARTLAAFLAFPAVTWLCFLADDRWSSFEIPLQTATLGLVVVGIGAVLARDDLQGRSPSVPGFVLALVTAITLLLALQLVMRHRARGVPAPATTAGATSE